MSLDADLRMDGIPALDLCYLVIEVFHSSPHEPKKSKERVQGELLRDTPWNKHTQNQTKIPIQHDTLELRDVDHVSCDAKSLLILMQSSMILRTMKAWFQLSWKAKVQQWDTYPESTESLLTDCLTESIWITKFRSGRSTSNINLQTYWRREISLRISALLAALKSMTKRMQEEKGEERIVTKSRTTLNLTVTVSTSSSSEQNPNASKSPWTLRWPCQSDWKSTGRLVAREHNQYKASSCQTWQKDSIMDESTRRLEAADKNQELLNIHENLEYEETPCFRKF